MSLKNNINVMSVYVDSLLDKHSYSQFNSVLIWIDSLMISLLTKNTQVAAKSSLMACEAAKRTNNNVDT